MVGVRHHVHACLCWQLFFESHNPCQGMRQGNDVGTQYRSGIYYYNDQQKNTANAMKEAYESVSSLCESVCLWHTRVYL